VSKPVLGLLLGGVLGIFDGLTAWFTPEVRNELPFIIMGSTGKGLVAGLLIGLLARKLKSVPLGVLCGLLIAAAVTYPIAANPDPNTGKVYFWQIILPGSLVGAIVGFATQKMPAKASETSRTAAA
jgi:hypothetical protein